MKPLWLLFLGVIWQTQTITINSLNTKCMCDVSASCDSQCCCDTLCPANAITYWSQNHLCANDGFTIPFCSALQDQSYHIYDLYQGLSLIYTIVKRLFCISTSNFVDPTAEYTSSTSNRNLDTLVIITSATNPSLQQLNTVSTYAALPNTNGAGLCVATAALKNMQNVLGKTCQVYLSTVSVLSTNALLSINQFVTSNNLDDAQFRVFMTEDPSLFTQSSIAASAVSTTCTFSGSDNLCNVVKELNLFFVQSSGVIDYSASYAVVGKASISGASYISIRYSYHFVQKSSSLPYTSNVAYDWNRELLFLKEDVVTGSYYRMFNPLNLAFRKMDGSCRTASTDSVDPVNLLRIRFGQNSIHSCIGTTSFLYENIQNALSHVAAIGTAHNNLQDYVSLQVGAGITNSNSLQLLFYYVSVGTRDNPQYKILKVELNGVTATTVNQPTLFVEFSRIPTSVVLNTPSPPTIDAYLPDDFLYPFYVA